VTGKGGADVDWRRRVPLHWHVTDILLEKLAPSPILASDVAKFLSSRSAAGKLSSCGLLSDNVQSAGAPTSRTGLFELKPKSMKNSGS
jgi:hypothetical protein